MQQSSGKTSLWQMIKFTLFSISAGVIQAVSFALLLEAFKLPYWPSYLISLILSVLWNFTFNRRYTFRSDANITRSMLLVALFYVVFTPVSTWAGAAATAAGWNEYLVLGLTMLSNFVLEFLFQRYVVYRNTVDTNDVARRAEEKAQNTEA